jgi:hypothetical protein
MSDFGIFLLVGGFVLVVFLLRHKKDITAKGLGFEFRARDGDGNENPKTASRRVPTTKKPPKDDCSGEAQAG